MKKLVASVLVCLSVTAVVSGSAFAAKPGEISNTSKASVNNTDANPNACWGQDRSFYASSQYFGDNMDIKQSFAPGLGGVGDQRAEWVSTYCPLS